MMVEVPSASLIPGINDNECQMCALREQHIEAQRQEIAWLRNQLDITNFHVRSYTSRELAHQHAQEREAAHEGS